MKKSGLITLGIVAGLVAIVLAASQVGGGSPGGGFGPEGSSTDLTVRLADGDGAPKTAPSDELEQAPFPAAGGPFQGATSPGSGGPGTGGGDVAPPLPDFAGRKLVRDATISLEVGDVAAAVQRVEAVAGGAGGFVSASSVFVDTPPESLPDDSRPPQRTQSATVTIRVPSSAYASVMSQLRDMADEVRSESSTTSDVTEEFTDLQARLRNLEATEARYLDLLGKANDISDILTVQDRINAVRLEIERIQGRINLLDDLSDLATIVVQLNPPALVVEAPSEAGWAQQAWDDAWETSTDVLQALGTAGIVVGVVLAWLAVPALAIAIAWRLLGPRRQRSGEA